MMDQNELEKVENAQLVGVCYWHYTFVEKNMLINVKQYILDMYKHKFTSNIRNEGIFPKLKTCTLFKNHFY